MVAVESGRGFSKEDCRRQRFRLSWAILEEDHNRTGPTTTHSSNIMNNETPPVIRQSYRIEDDPSMKMVLPVGRSIHAIIAGYLALFSVLILPGPLALLFGLLAVRDIRRSRDTPNPKYGMGRAVFGIIMGGLATALILFGIVAAILNSGS
jgi:hypothetical protein